MSEQKKFNDASIEVVDTLETADGMRYVLCDENGEVKTILIASISGASIPIRDGADKTISASGKYVFIGTTQRDWILNDNIKGSIKIFNSSTADLVIDTTNINSNFGGRLIPGETIEFIWEPTEAEYVYF